MSDRTIVIKSHCADNETVLAFIDEGDDFLTRMADAFEELAKQLRSANLADKVKVVCR